MERISQKGLLLVFVSLLLILLTGCPPKDNDGGRVEYVCADNCEGIQKVTPIPNQFIVVFDEHITDQEKNDVRDSLSDMGDTTHCMCGDDIILLEVTPPVGQDESLGGVRGNVEDEGVKVYENINISIGFTGLGTITPVADSTKVNSDARKTVAVVDGGIDKNTIHEYVWVNPNELPNNRDDDDNCLIDDIKGFDFSRPQSTPLNAHGTIVANLITEGRIDEEANVIDLRIFTDNGESTLFDALCALEYAKNKAHVINMSWGYYSGGENELKSYDSLLLRYLREKVSGQLLIASAGNDNVNTDVCMHFPSGFYENQYVLQNIISVTAVEQNELSRLADYANCGPRTVAVAANGDYDANSYGTSYAAPRVANEAIRYWAANPGLSAGEVRRCILESVSNVGLPIHKGGVVVPNLTDLCDNDNDQQSN